MSNWQRGKSDGGGRAEGGELAESRCSDNGSC